MLLVISPIGTPEAAFAASSFSANISWPLLRITVYRPSVGHEAEIDERKDVA